MSNSASHDIALYLAAQGVGTFGGNLDWSIHDGGLPAHPSRAVGVASSSGQGPETDQLDIFRPNIQILTCSKVKTEAYAQQEEIRELLIRNTHIETPTSVFTQIDMVTDFLDIGQDQLQRYVWSANYRTRRVLT